MTHDTAFSRRREEHDAPTDVRLTTERKAQLVALVELDREMTIDELMFIAGAYEDLANRKHEQRRAV